MNENLQQLMQMGQQLQARIAEIQNNLDGQEVTATSGGGMVAVSVDGKGAVKKISIEPTVVDPADVEMLEDLVLAAMAEAQKKARTLYEEEMRKAAGGLPVQIPGLF